MRTGIRSFVAIAALTASATLTLFTDSALALGAGTCSAYADRAVEQGQRARDMKCGFGVSETGNAEHPGPAWSIDRNAYIRECRRWGAESTPNERNAARDKELNKCSACATYAVAASNRSRENLKFSCGFSGGPPGFNGPVFDTKYQPHFDFCMGSKDVPDGTHYPTDPSHTPDFIAGIRDDAIKDCKDKFTPEQIALCLAYSEKATNQAVRNFQNECGNAKDGDGVSTGRWTTNSDAHFAFCTSGLKYEADGWIYTAMNIEEEKREEANNRCAFKQAGGATAKDRRIMNPQTKRILTKVPEGGVQRSAKPAAAQSEKPAAASSSSAMDRLGAGATPASGGSYKSRDGAPTQTRSSGGASSGSGTPSESWSGPNLRMSPGSGNIKQDTFKGGQVN
ncbi:MAG TPA: hypothetical protein VJQ55_00760 [Candidatus Binatia bacterium]|nr:hypothetical protein [Candidatus Binatia bacterium]